MKGLRGWVDPEDGAREFLELWSAPDADAFHRVLVMHAPIRRSADAFEPLMLLKKHHETEPETSPTTALLLLTDRRWRSGAGHLVRHIADSGVLDGEHLDLLARTFLAAGKAVYWEVPDAWFGDGVVIDLDSGRVEDDDGDVEVEGPAVVRRDVPAPLRRWAAGYVVTGDPAAWGGMLARARELDARSAAAVISGLLDAVEVIELEAQAFLVREAIVWPDQGVRRLGLSLLAQREGPDRAYALARKDPNARIRAWAESLLAAPSPADVSDRDEREEEAPTLF